LPQVEAVTERVAQLRLAGLPDVEQLRNLVEHLKRYDIVRMRKFVQPRRADLPAQLVCWKDWGRYATIGTDGHTGELYMRPLGGNYLLFDPQHGVTARNPKRRPTNLPDIVRCVSSEAARAQFKVWYAISRNQGDHPVREPLEVARGATPKWTQVKGVDGKDAVEFRPWPAPSKTPNNTKEYKQAHAVVAAALTLSHRLLDPDGWVVIVGAELYKSAKSGIHAAEQFPIFELAMTSQWVPFAESTVRRLGLSKLKFDLAEARIEDHDRQVGNKVPFVTAHQVHAAWNLTDARLMSSARAQYRKGLLQVFEQQRFARIYFDRLLKATAAQPAQPSGASTAKQPSSSKAIEAEAEKWTLDLIKRFVTELWRTVRRLCACRLLLLTLAPPDLSGAEVLPAGPGQVLSPRGALADDRRGRRDCRRRDACVGDGADAVYAG
jgi:hypothetical protein